MPCKNHPTVHANLNQCSRCSDLLCADCLVLLSGKYLCANCKGEQVKDIQSGAETGELDRATVLRRWGALILDSLILGIPFALIGMVLGIGVIGLPGVGGGGAGVAAMVMLQLILTAVAVAINIVYEGWMLQKYGQTLGKMICKIRVVGSDGSPLTNGQAWGRAAGKVLLSQIPLVGLINYLIALGKDRTTLHDRLSSTHVVNWNQ